MLKYHNDCIPPPFFIKYCIIITVYQLVFNHCLDLGFSRQGFIQILSYFFFYLQVNNAGILVKGGRRETVEGHEAHLGTNYLGRNSLYFTRNVLTCVIA